MTAFIFLVSLNLAPAWVVAIIVCRELAVTGLRLIVVENDGEVIAAKMIRNIVNLLGKFILYYPYLPLFIILLCILATCIILS